MPDDRLTSPVDDTFVRNGDESERRALHSHSRRPIALAAVMLVLGTGVVYLISREGWAGTARRVYGVAEAVKTTTAAVRDTSADAATTAKARAALALSKRLSGSEFNVDTTDAVATLTGRVPTPEAREAAGQIVADTSGVRDVRNLLTVDPSMMRPEEVRERLARRVNDLEIQTALFEALQDCPELGGARVKVRVADGAVTLDGTVTSEAQKSRAEEVVRAFPGVQRLSDRLSDVITAAPPTDPSS
jgi:hyperosmotically inducible protein